MKSLKHVFILLLFLPHFTIEADSLRVRNDFLEIKTGAVVLSRAGGREYKNGPTYKAKGTTSETFGISVGKCIRNFVFSFNLDYARFRFTGESKSVGYQEYKSTKWVHAFNIYQKTAYYDINSGIAFYYRLRFKKFFVLMGPSAYVRYYRSPVTIRNYYTSEQPVYGGTKPTEGIAYEAQPAQGFEDWMPYFGINFNINYFLNRRWSVAVYGSFFYNPDLGLYHNGPAFLEAHNTELPHHYLDYLTEQRWITSGLTLMYWF